MIYAGRPRRAVRRAHLALAAATSLFLGSTAAYAEGIKPDGIWYDKDQSTIIRMHPCNDAPTVYCGTIVWLKSPTEADGTPALDKNNKDESKRSRPVVGINIFTKMAADDDHWTGKVYNPDDGKVYDVTFTVKTDKEPNDSADVRGCLFKVLCRTETFTRAKDVPGGEPVLAETTPPKKHKSSKKDAAKDSAHR